MNFNILNLNPILSNNIVQYKKIWKNYYVRKLNYNNVISW